MSMADILFAQLGLDKEEVMNMAHEAATVVKSVDARMSRIERKLDLIGAAQGLDFSSIDAERTDDGEGPRQLAG